MKRWLSSAFVLFLLLAPACRKQERPYPTAETRSPAEATSTAVEEGGTVVRWLQSDIHTLNPGLIHTGYEKHVLSYVFDPLVDLDQQMNLVPAIAASWEISPDGLSYTFHLDPKATFSDRTPVLASDVVFTIKKLVDPKSESVQFASLFDGLVPDQTLPLDPHTVRVVFKTARASQLAAFNIPILPEHVYGKGDFVKELNMTAVGAGPYVVSSREAGKSVLLERRVDYWRKTPYLRRVLFKVIPDDNVAWNALKRGDIDEMRISSDQWKLEGNSPELQKTIEIHKNYLLSYNFIPWNNRDPILSDKQVRRALSMALDRKALINNLYYGTARIITGPFTPDQWAYNPAVPPIEYDPEGARRTLAVAGWNDSNGDGVLDKAGKKLALEFLIRAGNKTSEQLAQVYQASLKQIGVQLDVRPVDDATYFDRILTGKYQGATLAWDLDVDPDPYNYFHSSQFPPAGQNFVYYSNPEADKLMEQGRHEFDFDKRVKIYQQLHELLANDQPYTWTVQVSEKWAVNRRVHGVEDAKGLGLYLWYPGPYDWWIPASQRTHEKLSAPAR